MQSSVRGNYFCLKVAPPTRGMMPSLTCDAEIRVFKVISNMAGDRLLHTW